MTCSKSLQETVCDVTECSICTETMVDPRVLPCIHTFCFKCLDQLWKGKQPGVKVPCPMCRTEVVIPVEGVSSLPKNFFVEKLIGAQKLSTTESTTANCDVCMKHRGTTSVSGTFCVECQQHMCDGCWKFHNALNITSTHHAIPTGSEQSVTDGILLFPDTHCESHAEKKIKIYCIDCKVAVCTICFITKHNGHTCSDIKQVAEGLKAKIKTNIEETRGIVVEVNNQSKALEELLVNFGLNVEETQSRIVQKGEQMKQLIDKHVQALLQELDGERMKKIKEFEVVKEELLVQKLSLESFIKYSEKILEKAVPADVASVAEDLSARFESLKNEEITRIGKCVEMTFIPNNSSLMDEKNRNVIGSVKLGGTIARSTESAAMAASLAEQTGKTDPFKHEGTEKLAMKTDLENRKRIETIQNNRKDDQFLKTVEIGLATFSRESHGKVVLEGFKPKPAINILILGGKGVGKSTWINGIVNYMTYPSLDVAREQKPPLSLIGSSFTMTDENYQLFEIHLGDDKNEVNNPGTSATQSPRSYVFENEDKLIRLIDTPGIGDTRSIEQDKKNFDMILKYLANLDKLHGICILLKPNNARLTVMFRFCIKELLTHLHKDAAKNIVFCFTNARSTFYRPGDTLPSLNELLQESKNVKIPVNKNNIYCMDNEAFRFLCASHQGFKFDENDVKNFSASWDKSVAETNKMFDMIATLEPHKLTNTILLNDARKIIVTLTEHKFDIQVNMKLEKAQDFVTEVSPKFGSFLKTNAIFPYNDATADYLNMLIHQERQEVGAGGDRQMLDRMLSMQNAYKEDIKSLDRSMNSGGNDSQTFGPEDVRKLVEEFYKLPMYGKLLKDT